MGRNEFIAWTEQVHREQQEQERKGDSWDASEEDPRWQEMRQKREKLRGR
jgi:hypothetical protein